MTIRTKYSEFPDRYTFDSFVEGTSNTAALSAAKDVATFSPSYNPLYISGETGSGKSHLLQAIGCQLTETYPDLNVLYITAWELANATDAEQVWYLGYSPDVLLLDGLEDITRKTAGQERLSQLLDRLLPDRHVVVASQHHLSAVTARNQRLGERLANGTVLELSLPDQAMLLQLFLERAKERELEVPEQLGEIVARTARNPRQVEAVVAQLASISELHQRPAHERDMEEALRTLRLILTAPRKPTLVKIMDLVADDTGISVEQILSPSRSPHIVQARQLVFYLARRLTGLSYPALGGKLDRDHTTVMHGEQRVRDRMKKDRVFARKVEALGAQALEQI